MAEMLQGKPDDAGYASATNETPDPDRQRHLGIIRESMDEFDRISTEENENRANAVDDLKFKIGEQWDEQVKQRRITERRPCLTVNQLPQFIKDVVNDARQRRPQIKIIRGENGDPQTACAVDGMVREIQYKSSADSVYDSGFENAVSSGFGYWRVLKRYTDEKSFDQELFLKRIRNPFTVYYGEHINPDGSDVRRVFVTEWMPTSEFKEKYPGKQVMNWDALGEGDRKRYANWIRNNEVRIAERFCRKFIKKSLWLLQRVEGGQPADDQPAILSIFSDEEIPAGYARKMIDGKLVERDTFVEEIWWYKLTCTEVLEEKKLDGKYIPIVPCWGEETDVEGRVYRNGLIRFAKDPARSYNYWFTTATELIALAPKAPYIGAEGMFKGHEAKWRQANQISFPYLEYVPKSIGGQVVAPPARQPFAEMPQGVMQMILLAREDLRTTTGKYQRAELAQQGPEQSGRALIAERQKGELATFNYIDNLARAIELTGKIIVDQIPYVYDRDGRSVLIRKEDGTTEYLKLNTEDGKRDVRKGGYGVAVAVGPGFATRRQEAAAAKLEFMRIYPAAAPMIADLIARGSDWEDADTIANRLKAMLPAEIKAMEDSGDEQLESLPPQAREIVVQSRAQVAQLSQQLEQTQVALANAAKQLDDKQSILANDRYKADSAAESKVAVAEIQGAVKVATSELTKTMGEVMAQVSAVAAGLGQVTTYITDMRKREQELAAEGAAAAAKAEAGPTPPAIRPEAAEGSAQGAIAA